MRTGILVLARLGSVRLPDKHLIRAGDRTFIEWLAYRFLHEFKTEVEKSEVSIIIATSSNKENKAFEPVFSNTPVTVFYGADANIPLRQLECAQHYGLDHIISIDGDDILCSVKAARCVYDALMRRSPAVKTSGLPLGLNCMGYSVAYLQQAVSATQPGAKFETGWGRLFEATIAEIPLSWAQAEDRLRFTLDYKEDAQFFKAILEHFKDGIFTASDNDIVRYVTENEVYELNCKLSETYWNNFNEAKQAES